VAGRKKQYNGKDDCKDTVGNGIRFIISGWSARDLECYGYSRSSWEGGRGSLISGSGCPEGCSGACGREFKNKHPVLQLPWNKDYVKDLISLAMLKATVTAN
jgi:hypothetical protein